MDFLKLVRCCSYSGGDFRSGSSRPLHTASRPGVTCVAWNTRVVRWAARPRRRIPLCQQKLLCNLFTQGDALVFALVRVTRIDLWRDAARDASTVKQASTSTKDERMRGIGLRLKCLH